MTGAVLLLVKNTNNGGETKRSIYLKQNITTAKPHQNVQAMTSCTQCNTEITLNYCPGCGQPATLKRINGHYIVEEISSEFHLEKGLLYTIWELLIHPGQNIRRFITQDRSRLIKPVLFIITTSLIYTLINHFFGIEDGYIKYTDTHPSTTMLLFEWMSEDYGYSNIIMGIFIALWLKLFFRKSPFNIFEILILLCFVMGIAMLIFALFALLQGLAHYPLMQAGGIVSLAYCTWAIGQFFSQKKVSGYLKAFAAYTLGMLAFVALLVAVGNLADLIKH